MGPRLQRRRWLSLATAALLWAGPAAAKKKDDGQYSGMPPDWQKYLNGAPAQGQGGILNQAAALMNLDWNQSPGDSAKKSSLPLQQEPLPTAPVPVPRAQPRATSLPPGQFVAPPDAVGRYAGQSNQTHEEPRLGLSSYSGEVSQAAAQTGAWTNGINAAAVTQDVNAAFASPRGLGAAEPAAATGPQVSDAALDRPAAQIPDAPSSPDKKAATEGLISDARRAVAMGDFKSALSALTRAIALDPDSDAAYSRRAEVYNRMGLFGQARADAAQAIKRNPRSANAWTQFAFASARLGQLDEALRAIDTALALDPNNATAHYVRYLILGKMGKIADAVAELEAAARLNARYQALLDKVKGANRFVDPDSESSLGDSASRVKYGLPLWVWGLLASAGALAAGLGVGGWYMRRRAALRPAKVSLIGPDGRLAGKYELGALIGRGGMGNVYAATDHSLGRQVAIKRMSDRLADMAPQARALLIKEAKTVAVLDHPSIVNIHEILEDGADLYLVFELVKGKTVQQLIAENGRLPIPRSCEILYPVCQALAFAHGRGLVHRDLKPANVMITEDGRVKLMDFGIARSLGDRVAPAPARAAAAAASSAALPITAMTTTVVGTAEYMAPEAEQGLVSTSGDIYALGCTLYEMTTGRMPFPEPNLFKKATRAYLKPSAHDPALPAGLDELIDACLQPDPAQRLQTVREFAIKLQALAAPRAAAGQETTR